jgi:hypothetical protein
LKIWLDDERPAPSGWLLARWPNEVIKLLKRHDVATISLDHDLGNDAHGTGYDVLLWIEEAVLLHGYKPPEILIHSANPAARTRMEAARKSINRLAKQAQGGENEY